MKRRRRKRGARRDFDKKILWKTIDKDERARNRAKVVDLETRLRQKRKEGPSARAEALARCRTGRLLARESIARLRARLKEDARKLVQAQREGARWQCDALKRSHGLTVQKIREELRKEKAFQADMRRLARHKKARRPGLASASVRRGESDDEVRSNIPSDLIPLFERVKRGIKAGPRKSRTEAFLHYVEEHPREQYGSIDDKTDELVRELERQQRAGRRDVRRGRRFR